MILLPVTDATEWPEKEVRIVEGGREKTTGEGEGDCEREKEAERDRKRERERERFKMMMTYECAGRNVSAIRYIRREWWNRIIQNCAPRALAHDEGALCCANVNDRSCGTQYESYVDKTKKYGTSCILSSQAILPGFAGRNESQVNHIVGHRQGRRHFSNGTRPGAGGIGTGWPLGREVVIADEIDGIEWSFAAGKLARLADGSSTLRTSGIDIMTTVVCDRQGDQKNFLPLQVNRIDHSLYRTHLCMSLSNSVVNI